MAVDTTQSWQEHTSDGSTAYFPFNFNYDTTRPGTIVVGKRTADNTYSVVDASNYELIPNASGDGGQIRFIQNPSGSQVIDDIPPAGTIVRIERVSVDTSSATWQIGLEMSELVNLFDRLFRLVQENKGGFDNVIKTFETQHNVSLYELLSAHNNHLLYWDNTTQTLTPTDFPKEDIVRATDGMFLRISTDTAGNSYLEWSLTGTDNWHSVSDTGVEALSKINNHLADKNNPHKTSMSKLTDTEFTNLSVGNFMMFDGMKWKNVSSSATAGWGTIIGNITYQTDLMNKFAEYVKKSDIPTYNFAINSTDTERNLTERFNDIINVKDFGAKGDGVTDDTTAFQAAIDYANSIGGGVVFGNGEFLISNVSVKSNVVITNTRVKCGIVDSASDNLCACFIFANNCSNSAVYNCKIDGNKNNQTTDFVCGIILKGTKNSIKNCTIKDSKRNGIHLVPGVTWCNISGNEIYDSGRFAITHAYSPDVTSSNCIISGNFIENTGNAAISFISGDDTDGYVPSAGVAYFDITNNVIKNTGTTEVGGGIGGYSQNNHHIVVANNIVDTATNHGVHFGGEHISIVDNIFRNVHTDSIFIRNWPNVMDYATTAKDITISNNTVDTTNNLSAGRGISLQNVDGFVISGNRITKTHVAAIYVSGLALGSTERTKRGVISGNYIKNVTDRGIYLISCDNVNITSNVVKDSTTHSIVTDKSAYILINHNNVDGTNGGHGIFVADSSGNSETKGVIVSCNSVINKNIGINVDGTYNRVIVRDNILQSNNVGQPPISTTQGIIESSAGLKLSGGGSATVANGGTIQHFLAATPTKYTVTAKNSDRVVYVSAVSSSTLTIGLTDLSGNPITTAESVAWTASATIGD